MNKWHFVFDPAFDTSTQEKLHIRKTDRQTDRDIQGRKNLEIFSIYVQMTKKQLLANPTVNI